MYIKISSYGRYNSDNYGKNTLQINLGGFVLFYSYATVVAFDDDDGLVISSNEWGPTTGKHLEWISTGRTHTQLSRSAFEEALRSKIEEHGMTVVPEIAFPFDPMFWIGTEVEH